MHKTHILNLNSLIRSAKLGVILGENTVAAIRTAMAAAILLVVNATNAFAHNPVYSDILKAREQALSEIAGAVLDIGPGFGIGPSFDIGPGFDTALSGNPLLDLKKDRLVRNAVAAQCKKHGKAALNQWFRLKYINPDWLESGIIAKMFWDGLCVDRDRVFAQQIYDGFEFYHAQDFQSYLNLWIRQTREDFFRIKDYGFEAMQDTIIDGVEYTYLFSNGLVVSPGTQVALGERLGLPGISFHEKTIRATPSIGTPFLNTKFHEKVWPLTLVDAYTRADILSDLHASTDSLATEGLQKVLENIADTFIKNPMAQMAHGVKAGARLHPTLDTYGNRIPQTPQIRQKKRAWLALALPHLDAGNPMKTLRRFGKEAVFKAPNLLVLASYVAYFKIDEQEYTYMENHKKNLQAVNKAIYAGVMSGFAPNSDKRLARTYIDIAYCRIKTTLAGRNIEADKRRHLQMAMYELMLFRNEPNISGDERNATLNKRFSALAAVFDAQEKEKIKASVAQRDFSLNPEDMGVSTSLKTVCLDG